MDDSVTSERALIGPVFVDRLVSVMAVALTFGAVAWAADWFRLVGLVLYSEQYIGAMLTLSLPLVYLAVPAGEGRLREGGRIPWYDYVAAILGAVVSGFTTIRFPELTELVTLRPTDGLIAGGVMLVLLIEGLRRTVGKVLTIVVLFFVAFALLGHLVPGALQGRPVTAEKLIYYLAWDSSAVLGIPMRIVTTIVVAFVLFGKLLFNSGGASFFTDIAMTLMGRYRGGPAKIAVFASGLFGSISGSVVSNIVSTGVVTIPMMRRGGYQAHHAGAIEAVASTGGQLMPPVMGAAAFLMAEFLGVEYKEVVVAALIPAILYYVALFIQADLEAARSGITRIAEENIPDAIPVLKAGWYFPLPFVVLIYALFWLNYSAETSALLAAAVVLVAGAVFGYEGRRLNVADLLRAMRETGLGVLDIFMIGAAAGMVIGALNISGLGFGLTLAMVQIASGHLIVLLLMAAAVCIILGMGMPTIGVYVLLATLVAPALKEVGIDEMSAHMFIFYFGMMSMITPPVAIGAFAAATLTGADPMKTGFAAMRFGWLAFVIPFAFVASPTLLLNGDPVFIALDFAGALLAAWLVSIGMVGHFVRPVGVFVRGMLIVAGLGLIVPLNSIPLANVLNIAGLVLGATVVTAELRHRKTVLQ